LKAVLLGSREIAPGTRHFEFGVEGVERFDFRPGQFVSMHREVEGKRITRAYSLCSVPDGNRFELCLNLVEGGRVSPVLFGLEPGDPIDFTGPVGDFVRAPQPADSLYIATGTGVAPMRGLLRETLPADSAHTHRLLFGTRGEEALLYRAEFEELVREHRNFHYWPTLTRADDAWPGRRGRVQGHLEAALGGRFDVEIYVCGLRAMVDEVRAQLKAMGYDRKRVHYERYD
jgi:CDP-4-dehydro-6-deoxyglucose reductase